MGRIIWYIQLHVLKNMQSDEEMVKRVMSCLAAYLDNPALSTDELAKSELLAAAFQLMVLHQNAG